MAIITNLCDPSNVEQFLKWLERRFCHPSYSIKHCFLVLINYHACDVSVHMSYTIIRVEYHDFDNNDGIYFCLKICRINATIQLKSFLNISQIWAQTVIHVHAIMIHFGSGIVKFSRMAKVTVTRFIRYLCGQQKWLSTIHRREYMLRIYMYKIG